MFNGRAKVELAQTRLELKDALAIIAAIKGNVALIEFDAEGVILDANPLFLGVVGYRLDDVVGKNHSMFCSSELSTSAEYRAFWTDLKNGRSKHGTFSRQGRGGQPIWLEASYFPVGDEHGRTEKVLKIAHDVTSKTHALVDQEAIYSAINKAMAIIEFTPDGHIVNANKNFLEAMNYSLSEIRGKHHRIFCDAEFHSENPNFWQHLAAGHLNSGTFKRVDARGNTVWLEASYNPVPNERGQVVKVVKFATLITERVEEGERTRSAAQLANQTALSTSSLAEQAMTGLASSREVAAQVSSTLQQTGEVIARLNEQARDISNMVNTIRGVAEQTNLLALNAAIEAARAGEYGRGFAVVADEVRKLAFNTSSATNDISSVVSKNLEVTKQVSSAIASVDELSRSNQDKIDALEQVVQEIESGARSVVEAVSSIR